MSVNALKTFELYTLNYMVYELHLKNVKNYWFPLPPMMVWRIIIAAAALLITYCLLSI